MEGEEGRQSPLADNNGNSSSSSSSNSSMSGDNSNNKKNSSSDSWMMLPAGNAAECNEDEEIERPRLEDSRASLVLQLPPELALLVPSQSRHLRPQDPLLSSTMVQDPAGLSLLDAAVQDWPNASSIRLGNSNSGNWGNVSNSAMEDSLSDRLNNADICLDASAAGVSALSVSASTAAVAASLPAAAPGNVTSEAVSVSGFDTDSSASASSASASTNLDVSSPRLRVLASDSGQHRQDEEQAQQHLQPPQQHQLALGLLQVCRLTLDVLSEGGLLRDDARGWLTPELLCDKLCDRIYCPMQPQVSAAAAAAAAAAPAAPSADSSIAAPMEFESPIGRVRHWLLADAGGGGCSPLRRRNVTNSV